MNTYSSLNEEKTDNEIKTDNQLRNTKKKLKKKENKLKDNFSESLQSEINKLKIMIQEFEDKRNPSPVKNTKKKRKINEDIFPDEKEIREYNLKRQKKIDEERKQKAGEEYLKNEKRKQKEGEEYLKNEKRRQKEREEYLKNEKRKQKEENERRQRKEDRERKGNILLFLEDEIMRNKDIPSDIKNLYKRFNHTKWKLLMKKYHPDKNNEDENNAIILNNIKDYHSNIQITYDETWVK